jgi:N utilization substance protein B
VPTRSAGRLLAVQTLYQLDLNPGDPRETFTAVAILHESPLVVHPDVFEATQKFGATLVEATQERREEIDLLLAEHLADNWTLARLGKVEKAILRLATLELIRDESVPTAVILNEALELTRDFQEDRAVKFVNGVLDRVAKVVRPGSGAG